MQKWQYATGTHMIAEEKDRVEFAHQLSVFGQQGWSIVFMAVIPGTGGVFHVMCRSLESSE